MTIEGVGRFSREEINAIVYLHAMKKYAGGGVSFLKRAADDVKPVLVEEVDVSELDEPLALLSSSNPIE